MKRWRRYVPLYIVVAITVVPIAVATSLLLCASGGAHQLRNLLQPQRPVPNLALTNLDGSRFDFRQLAGSWIFVMVDGGQCDKPCADKLLMMRQQRTMTGKDRDRIERVWLLTDEEPLRLC
jgi:cytochrome oxidase Cu insertion factor (SCO1/SenC/PrrC family)